MRRSRIRANVASFATARLHAQAGPVSGLHLRVLAPAAPGSRRGRYAALLRGQPAFGPPDGARLGASRADPTTGRGRAKYRTPDSSRTTADPPLTWATSVMELLAERGIDVSNRTVLRWVQTFGPQLAAEARKHRLPLGRSWYADEMFFFRGKDKWHLYRAVDEHGQVVDVLLSDHRDTTSAEAFFAQALGRSGQAPSVIITDHHQPYIKAIQRVVPTAVHIRSACWW